MPQVMHVGLRLDYRVNCSFYRSNSEAGRKQAGNECLSRGRRQEAAAAASGVAAAGAR